MSSLHDTAARLVASGRGILAADESITTMSSRLEAEGIPASQEARRDYRGMLLTAPGLAELVSGIIICDETFRETLDGTPYPDAAHERGLLVGVKVDTGTSALAKGGGAMITEGLDGLGRRLAAYAADGATFAKWRAVIDVDNASEYSLDANAHALARYAALCQEHGIVPIVEPEVLCAGDHDLASCATTTGQALEAVFDQLGRQRVDLAGIVLKPNMVTPGLSGPSSPSADIAVETLSVLNTFVPAEVPGVAFLSGGHPTMEICAYLATMNAGPEQVPWALTFSFGRALVSDALHAWGGRADNVAAAQDVLLQNCRYAAQAGRAPSRAGG